MPLLEWIATYCISALFWLWVVRFGGAAHIARRGLSWLVVSWRTPSHDPEVLCAIGWLMLIGSTAWFAAGLYVPAWRFHWT